MCLTLDSNSEIMGFEVTLQVEYEIPSRNIEESLVLVVEPLPIPKIPEHVIETQLKKYFLKYFSKSPIKCKIVTKTAYLTFENSAGSYADIYIGYLIIFIFFCSCKSNHFKPA